MCTVQCREAECGCKWGYVRDSEDVRCVAVEESDYIGPTPPLTRGENEEVKQCGACDGTYANPDPFCTLECRRPECGCEDEYVRNSGESVF